MKTHGMSRTPTHRSREAMLQRCLNPNNNRYEIYRGRGIKICDRWLESFENFFEDMGEKPEGLTIERIDNNKGYCKENCKWATYTQQARNQRVQKK